MRRQGPGPPRPPSVVPPKRLLRQAPPKEVLLILDMNGVLLLRSGSRKDVGQLRPYIDVLLNTLRELRGRIRVAVWSSMMAHNLHPLVQQVFGKDAAHLQFVWDQECCTRTWVPGMHKPLLRKDLVRLRQTAWGGYVPNRVLLVDDDPIKCTENPVGTAIHPSSFTGHTEGDTELLALSAYLRYLAEADGTPVPEFVQAQPYENFQADAAEAEWGEDDKGEEAEAGWGDDGEEAQPPAKKPRKAAQAPAAASDVEEDLEDAGTAGEAVEAFYPQSDEWLGAQLVETLADGTLRILWDEDFSESLVTPDFVRTPGYGSWRRQASEQHPGCFYYCNDETGDLRDEPPRPWERRPSKKNPGTFFYRNAADGRLSAGKPALP